MKITNSSFGILPAIVFLVACSNPSQPPKQAAVEQKTDTVITRDNNKKIANAAISQYNDFARFIAGLPQTRENNYSKLEKDSVWIKADLMGISCTVHQLITPVSPSPPMVAANSSDWLADGSAIQLISLTGSSPT